MLSLQPYVPSYSFITACVMVRKLDKSVSLLRTSTGTVIGDRRSMWYLGGSSTGRRRGWHTAMHRHGGEAQKCINSCPGNAPPAPRTSLESSSCIHSGPLMLMCITRMPMLGTVAVHPTSAGHSTRAMVMRRHIFAELCAPYPALGKLPEQDVPMCCQLSHHACVAGGSPVDTRMCEYK